MNIIIQKFGGTSMATKATRRYVIEKIKQALHAQLSPVIVVSAMGRQGAPYATDTLLGLVKGGEAMKANVDLLIASGEIIAAVVLADELIQEGLSAVVFTGQRAGIITDERFNDASIIDLQSQNVLETLNEGKIPVVAGFQGATMDGRTTTLGRGGSDTTAAALAVMLSAQMAEIYTDVIGIMTADPRLVPEASILPQITYEELCHLAYQGAKVVHPQAVELVMTKEIPLRVRSTFDESLGTLVSKKRTNRQQGSLLTGITYLDNICQIKLKQGDFEVKTLLESLSQAGITVDLLEVYLSEMCFAVKKDFLEQCKNVLNQWSIVYQLRSDCTKVSLVGSNMLAIEGIKDKIESILSYAGVEILQAITSDAVIELLMAHEYRDSAVRALHKNLI